MRYLGGVVLILASVFLSLKGFLILLKEKHYCYVTGHLLIIVGFPFLLFEYIDFIKNKFDGDIQLWLSFPIIILVPVWLCWGFFVNGTAEKK